MASATLPAAGWNVQEPEAFYSPASLECGCQICGVHAGIVLEGRDYLTGRLIEALGEIDQLKQMLRAPEAGPCVYFIQRETDGLVKIGTTRQLAHRIRDITKEHGAIRLLGTEAGHFDREHELHDRFEVYRREKEWFESVGELAKYLEVLQATSPEPLT